jgi:hypothetical protein
VVELVAAQTLNVSSPTYRMGNRSPTCPTSNLWALFDLGTPRGLSQKR